MSSAIERDANTAAYEWRAHVLSIIEEAATHVKSPELRIIVCNPSLIPNMPSEDTPATYWRYMIPVILSSNPHTYFDTLKVAFRTRGHIGLSKVRLKGSVGWLVMYTMMPIARIAGLRYRDEVATQSPIEKDGKVLVRASQLYLIPSLFRLIEEGGLVHDIVIKALASWMKSLPDYAGDGDHRRTPPLSSVGEAVVSVCRHPLAYITGVSSTQGANINLPIQLVTDDIPSVIEALSTTVREKFDVVYTKVSHPYYDDYVSLARVSTKDGTLISTIYDTLRSTSMEVTKKGDVWHTGSSGTIIHLGFTAWQLERRGHNKGQWVYRLMRKAIEHHDGCEQGDGKAIDGHRGPWTQLYRILEEYRELSGDAQRR